MNDSDRFRPETHLSTGKTALIILGFWVLVFVGIIFHCMWTILAFGIAFLVFALIWDNSHSRQP